MLKYSLAPASGQELSVDDQASMGDTSESHYLDGDGSSQAGTVPLGLSPGSFSGLSTDPYSGTEQAAQTNMPANFQGLSPGNQQPYGSHGFAQTNTQSWVSPTETPSHPYHGSGYGTSWAQPPQPPQPLQQAMHSLNPSPTALVFPNHHNPNLGYEVINTAPFHNAIPIRATIGIPEATPSDLEYIPLHGAVVSGDISSATALLQNRANPNTAAQGGATPLHCAAYHNNVDMINLLLSYGASLEATTDKGHSVLFFAVCGQGQLASIDMPGYRAATRMGNGLHTDERTVRTIDALFERPSHFVHLHNSIGKPDKHGVTPLMVAAGEGFFTTARMLLKHRAQPDQRDHANYSALKYAAMNNHRDIVHLLLQADPAISHKPDVSHILKLASKNIAGHGSAPGMLIAEEIVRQCRGMGVLDQLLRLAGQKGKTAVLECLQRAMAQSGSEASHAAGA